MRVGVIQSCYVPWRGYFDFIASVDLFVIYDDVQYSTGSWRNRNRVKMPDGLRWITVPVSYHLGMAIDEVRIGIPRKSWRDEHRRLLTTSLGPAPYFRDALALWEEAISAGDELLASLNLRLIHAICRYLKIGTRIVLSRDYALTGAKTERLVGLLTKLGARTYLSGPSARAYLDESLLRNNGITLEYKSYDYAPYPQLWGKFAGEVTILDLIANCGSESRLHITARPSNERSGAMLVDRPT